MRTSDAAIAITAELATQGAGESTTTFRLRDWLVSRQRYWGTPIPIIHCENCGIVPVPDDQLPVLLPTHGYQLASPDGKSPLESAADWVLISCPSCGNQARRDTDTMDTFVDSSWYFLRYPDPHYEEGPFNAGAVERWLPVAEYIGGKGQETAHLIYARFLTKALHDMGLVHVTEPFARLTTVGTVLMDGKAMSKSRGNLIKLQDQLGEFGPDAVRVAMAFAGPPQEDIDWADVSPAGAVKWLSRVSRLAGKVAARPADIADENMATSRVVHRLIAEVTTLMEDKRFNVAIARLMELTSVLSKAIDAEPGSIDPSAHKGTAALVSMLFCVAPHTATKAWHDLGNQGPIQDWPVIDETLLVAQTVTCIIQVNGKVRDRLEVSSNVSENELRRHALNSGRVQQILDGRMISKLVIKPPRLVSIVCE